jgi:glycosyltransferase involved in cell wall biosynthesis
VSVIIVSYHCRDDVLACVDSVVTGVFDHTLEVLVVDNGSTDGTVDALRDEFAEVTVLENGRERRLRPGQQPRHRHLDRPPRPGAQPRQSVSRPAALDRMIDWADDHPWAGVVAPATGLPDGATSRPPARSRRLRRRGLRAAGPRSPDWFP